MNVTFPTKEKRITLNDLAGMVQRGFLAVDKRFEDMDTKLDYRFNSAQSQLDNICLNYTTRQEHSLLKDRVKRVESKVGIRA